MVRTRLAFPEPPQIVNQIIQILVIHRIGQRWRQHRRRPRRPAQDTAAVAPALNRLKSLRPINHHIGASSADSMEENDCEEEESRGFAGGLPRPTEIEKRWTFISRFHVH
jgi:hypothetical protein